MKAAIIYSHSAKKTTQVANQIKKELNLKGIDDLNVEDLNTNDLKNYNLLILGASTWFDGELPDYWDELVPAIEQENLKNLKVAIFGNGNQVMYPDNFGDAVGLLAEVFESSGASIIGYTPFEGYVFSASKALRGNQFCGLLLDFENQHKKNAERIKEWVKVISVG